MTLMQDGLAAIKAEKEQSAKNDQFHAERAAEWKEYDNLWRTQRGAQYGNEGLNRIMGLVRDYGPKIAGMLGYPAAAGAMASLAPDGTFSLGGVLSKIGGIFGLG